MLEQIDEQTFYRKLGYFTLFFVVGLLLISKGFSGVITEQFDGFEDGDYTANPEWNVYTGSFTVDTNRVRTGTYSLEGDANTATNELELVGLANQGNASISAWVNTDTHDSFNILGLSMEFNNDSNMQPQMIITGTNDQWSCNGTDFSSGGWTDDAWYKIQMTFDFSNNKLYCIVYDTDGTSIIDDHMQDSMTYVDNVTLVRLRGRNYNQEIYYDDVYYNYTLSYVDYNTTKIFDNSTTHFVKHGSSLNLNFTTWNESGVPSPSYLNITSDCLGLQNETQTGWIGFSKTFDNDTCYNYSVIVTDYFNSSITETFYFYTSTYNISDFYYNSTVTNGTTENLIAEVGERLSTSQINNVSITVNDTIYYPTQSGFNYTLNNILFSTNNLIESIPFQVNLTLKQGSEFVNLSNNYTISIINLEIDDCSTFTNTILNVSVMDERNPTSFVTNASLRLSFNVSDALISFEKFNDSDGIIQVCLNNTTPFTADVDFSFFNNNGWGATDKREREHFYFQQYFPYQINQSVFKLTETYADKIIFNLVDNSQQPLKNYYVELLRWYGDGYETVAMAKTDVNGQAITYVEYNDPYYAFIIRDTNGVSVYETDRIILTSTPTTLQVPTGTVASYFTTKEGFSYSNSWTNTTNYFTSVMSNLEGEDSVFNLQVYSYNGSMLCNVYSGSTTSFSTSCEVTNWNSTIFTVKGTGFVDGQSVLLYYYEIDDVISGSETFEAEEGILILAGVIIISSLLLVCVSPTFLPLSPAISILFTNLVGITNLSWFMVGGVSMVGFVFMFWFMRS